MRKKTSLCWILLLFLLMACKNTQNNGETVTPALITKITIGGNQPVNGIGETMNFELTNEKKVKVYVETSPKNAEITYMPKLEGNFWKLKLQDKNELTISVKVEGQAEPTVYRAKITHEVAKGFGKTVDTEIINYISIGGISVNGETQDLSVNKLDEILQGKDVVAPIEGPIATIRVGWSPSEGNPTPLKPDLKKVTINSKDMPKGEKPPYADYEYVFDLPLAVNDITDVIIDAEAQNGTKTQLVFKIIRGETLVDIPGMWLFLDDDAIMENNSNLNNFVKGDHDGKFQSFDAEDPTKVIVGVVGSDILEAIEIEDKKETPKTKVFKDGKSTFYYVEKSITGISPNNKYVKVTLIPKDKNSYTTTTLNFNLHYYPASKNADFVFMGDYPRHEKTIVWKNEGPGKADNFYGAKSITMTLYTKVPTTKVFYKKMLLLWHKDSSGNQIVDKEEALTSEVQLTYTEDANAEQGTRYKHTLTNCQLDEDKPTTLRFFTRSQDGTEDAERGSVDFEFNPIKLRWDYTRKEKGKGFANTAWDTIEIEKGSVQDNKIHVVFRLYDELEGFKIDNTKIKVPHQKAFERIEDKDEPVIAWMCSEVDVSDLLKESGAKEELEIVLPVQEKIRDTDGKLTGNWLECFEYKVKIKLKK